MNGAWGLILWIPLTVICTLALVAFIEWLTDL